MTSKNRILESQVKKEQFSKQLLEKEIEKVGTALYVAQFIKWQQVRMTRGSQLDGQEGDVGAAVFLGRQGKQFEFKDLNSNVTFEEGTATELDSLVGLRQWLVSLA